jgi:hypothetical protein
MQETRDIVVRLFEAARQAPGTSYDADRLLAFLSNPPEPKGRQVADTFAGRRRLVRFMDAVQMEFGVCFTNDDWDRGYGLDDLVVAIEKKRQNPQAQARLAEKRVKEAASMVTLEPIKFGVIAAAVLAVPAVATSGVVRIVFAGLWIAIVAGIATVTVRQHKYAQRLAARIAQDSRSAVAR